MGAKRKTLYLTSALGSCLVACAGILMFEANRQTKLPTQDPLTPPITLNTPATGKTTLTTTSSTPSTHAKPATNSSPKTRPSFTISPTEPSGPTFMAASGQTYPLRTYKTLATNDPYGTQWWTTGTGLELAWSLGAGPHQTTIAVIDTGFALGHEELAGRWATNSNEQGATAAQNPSKLNCSDRGLALNKSCNLIDDDYNGTVDDESGSTTFQNPSQRNCTDRSITLNKSCNLVDDDGNGYVDDVTGWDFANNDASVQAGQTMPSGTGTDHGTEVAGILAATGNNSKGLAGVNWSAKLLPLQAINDDGYGNTLTVGQAIYYAADRGVDIISVSLGSAGSDPYTRQAVQYALDKGSLVVAASGNDGCNCMLYPANYPEVLAVGAHNSSNQRSSFSSFGGNLDIVAPGQNMISSTWTSGNQTSAYVGGIGGTSFAAPYVSGILALARSHQPDASWGELVASLLSTANHNGLSGTTPFSAYIGSGYARGGNYLARITTPSQPGMRHAFSPLSQIGALGSARVFECAPAGNFPTTLLYEIVSGSSAIYTIDQLEVIRETANGKAVRIIGRACVGLPGDTPAVTRVINLPSEINRFPAKH